MKKVATVEEAMVNQYQPCSVLVPIAPAAVVPTTYPANGLPPILTGGVNKRLKYTSDAEGRDNGSPAKEEEICNEKEAPSDGPACSDPYGASSYPHPHPSGSALASNPPDSDVDTDVQQVLDVLHHVW